MPLQSLHYTEDRRIFLNISQIHYSSAQDNFMTFYHMYNKSWNCFHDLQGPIWSDPKPLTPLKPVQLHFLLLSPSPSALLQLTCPFCSSSTPRLLPPQGLCYGCVLSLGHPFLRPSNTRFLRKAFCDLPHPKCHPTSGLASVFFIPLLIT